MMTNYRISAYLVSFLVVAVATTLARAADVTFQIEPGQACVVANHGTRIVVSNAREPATDKTLTLSFLAGPQYPNALFMPIGATPWDWSGFGAMAIRVRNPAAEPVTFAVRIDDDLQTKGGTVHCETASIPLGAGETSTLLLSFSSGGDPMTAHGMRAGPPSVTLAGTRALSGSGSVEAGHITSF
jgi:hypothetical protein